MNIFDFAMQMEKDGEAYYRKLASEAGDEGLAEIFNMMASDEVKHFETFKKLKEKQAAAMPETAVLKNSKNVFAALKTKAVQPNKDQVKAYKMAQELEKKSEDFYRQKVLEVDDKQIKKLFAKIADEEKKHFFLLENIIQFVLRPQTWLEDAEFNHLEEY